MLYVSQNRRNYIHLSLSLALSQNSKFFSLIVSMNLAVSPRILIRLYVNTHTLTLSLSLALSLHEIFTISVTCMFTMKHVWAVSITNSTQILSKLY